jgi:hypothetical protein
MPDELRLHIRDEPAPDDATVVVRGGPDNLTKLARHAMRTSRAYVLNGEPLLGVSVFLALDDAGPASLDGLLSGRMETYRVVYTASVANVREAGFGLLATFGRPHYTLILPDTSQSTLGTLAAALGTATANPYHVARRRR